MKLQITEVRFDATYNKGNYESEKIGVTCSLSEGEDVFAAIETLRKITKGEKSSVASKEEIKVGVKKPEVKKPEVKKVEVEIEEVKEVEAPAKEVAPKEVKEKTPKKEKAAKVVPYSRTNDVHKKLLGSFLDKSMPSWKVGPNLKKASEISKELDGKEAFLDEVGNLLESFKELFLQKMR